jgi:hypothetical protein
MKILLPLCIALLSFSDSFAQSKKIEIVCGVYQNHVYYGWMQEIIPDSGKHPFILFNKKWSLSDLQIVISFLHMNGACQCC